MYMNIKPYARKTAAVILFSAALMVMLGAYLASFITKNSLFLPLGVFTAVVMAAAASALWDE